MIASAGSIGGSAATGTVNLRFIAEALAKPPFNKKLSIISLHDDLPYPDLIALVSEVMAQIDINNPNNIHNIDIRNESPEITGKRMADFAIGALGFTPSGLNEVPANKNVLMWVPIEE
jgi:intraflagellar transport protein 81